MTTPQRLLLNPAPVMIGRLQKITVGDVVMWARLLKCPSHRTADGSMAFEPEWEIVSVLAPPAAREAWLQEKGK